MDFFGVMKALGPAGLTVFVVMLVMISGLTQLVKAIYRKWQRARGVAEDATLSSFGVALISVVVGALLGAVMLGGAAARMEVELPAGLAGALLGGLLGLVAWGLVGLIFQLRTREGAEDAQRLLALMRQLPTPVALPVPYTPPPAPGQPSYPPGPAASAEEYEDATTNDLVRMTAEDWPDTPAARDPDWRP